ncbi:hypothetical protein B0H14DRAFT_3427203 [Mycena olivaceomarginata]|nr:hypothetical protein B0H14DRAFT_3427203 [Mycena olivaceomarginata]
MSLQFIPYDPTGTKKAKKTPAVVQPLSMPTVASSLPQTTVLPPATNSTADNSVQSNLDLSPSEPPPTTVAQVSSGTEVPSSEGNSVSGPPVVEDPAPRSEERIEGDGPPSSAPGGELPSGVAPDDNDDDWVDDDDQSSIPAGKPGISTWCERNPQRRVIPLRKGRKKQTAETRATAKMKRAVNKEKLKNLQLDIDSINAARNKLAEETAAKHGVKVELVLRRLMALGSYQHERKSNLFNAKTHDACKKARQEGESIGWAEGKRRARENPEYQNLTKAQKQVLLAQLNTYRETMTKGTRATNSAAAADARCTIKLITEEMEALAQRTGMVGFAMFSRGHIHDKTIPTECQSLGALDFFEEIVGENFRDVGEKFELWCIAREKGLTGIDTLQSMRKQVNKAILAGLASATGAKKITMNWVQYWKKIVLKRHVIIRSWPLEGDPRNPASIHDVESMTKLRDAWASGDCYWQKLNGDEQEEVKEMYEQMVASGEVEEIVRKTRIDKGSSRKSQPSEALSTRSKAKDAPRRRVWEEDETTDEEGTRQKEKERRKAEKEKEKARKSEKAKPKVKARKLEKGSKKRKADDTTDPRLAKRQSTSRKVDPPSAKRKSTAGDGGRSQKRKRQDDSDCDEPTPKSRSKQAPDAAKSRFAIMQDKLRALAEGKSGSITSKLPPSMRKGPPGIRPGTVEFKALNLKGMDEDSHDDSDSDN